MDIDVVFIIHLFVLEILFVISDYIHLPKFLRH